MEQRRSYEYKVTLALWSALAILAAALLSEKTKLGLTPCAFWIAAALLIGVWLVYVLAFLRGVISRNYSDTAIAKPILDWLTRSTFSRVESPEELRAMEEAMDRGRELFSPKRPMLGWGPMTEAVIAACLGGLVLYAMYMNTDFS